MTEQQTIHYALASTVDLDRLVSDLSDVDASTIVVEFDRSRGWQATDLELARLVAASRSSGKRLIAEHNAGETASRAVLAGFDDMAVVSDPSSSPMPETSSFQTESEQPTKGITTGLGNDEETSIITPADKFSSTANLATYRPASEAETAVWNAASNSRVGERSAEPIPLGITPISRSSIVHNRQNAAKTSSQTEDHEPKSNASLPSPRVIGRMTPPRTGPEPEPELAAPAGPARRNRGRSLKIAVAVIAPVLVLVVVAALAIYMLPTATVTLVPNEEPISSTLTYGVATTNASYDIELDPTSISTSSSAEVTREATGERFEPVGTATGSVQITNPLTQEVTVPAGTELPAPNGVTYYTAEDVRLSAADPYGAMSFGSGNVGVYAGVIGPDGNLDPGALTGQLGNEIFYTNPGTISGGRMERHSVITEGDISEAREQVANDLISKARDEFEAEIPDGYEIVPGSTEISEPDVEVSPSEEQDGNEVTARGTIKVTGKIYDPEELHQMASSEADRQLSRQGGSERILLAETVDLHEPSELGTDEPGFEINVEATARTVITESERQALIDELVGMTREEVQIILSEHPKVNQFEIDIEPDWLLDRMPEFANRITVRVSSGEPTASR